MSGAGPSSSNIQVAFVKFCFYQLMRLFRVCVEPVNGAAPRVPPTAKITVLLVAAKTSMAMLCQAQANPLPIFRYVAE